MVHPFHTLRAASLPPSLPSPGKPTSASDPALSDFRSLLQEQSPPAKMPALTTAPMTAPVAPLSPIVVAPPSYFAPVTTLANKGLMANPTGNNYVGGDPIPYNPNFFATLDAAKMLAQQTGGTVVDRQIPYFMNQPQYEIDLPNGISVNAGNLIAIYNNPLWQGNPGIMDHMLAEVLNNNAIGTPGAGNGTYTVKNGQISYDPNTPCPIPPSPWATHT